MLPVQAAVAVCMAVVVADLQAALRRILVTAGRVQSVLSGPAQPANSHQQIQGTYK